MIGSLPYASADQALTILDKYPLAIPAWPQLPKRSYRELMVPQYSEAFPGIIIDDENKKINLVRDNNLMEEITTFFQKAVDEKLDNFAITENHAAGLIRFLKKLQDKDQHLSVIKGQITGPFTFGLGINDLDNKPIWFDEQYREIIIKGLTMKVLWQIQMLKKYADHVIIFLDEPILSALGTPAYVSISNELVINSLNEIISAAQKAGALVGIHCCGNMDWSIVLQTKINILNFDAYYYGDRVALYKDEIINFLERDGYLAWGIVPTVGLPGEPLKISQESPDSLKKRLDNLINLFVQKGIPEEPLKKQKLITPSCGMGSISEQETELVLEYLLKI